MENSEKFQTPAEKKLQQELSQIATILAIDCNTALQTIQFRLIDFSDFVKSIDNAVERYQNSKTILNEEFANAQPAKTEAQS